MSEGIENPFLVAEADDEHERPTARAPRQLVIDERPGQPDPGAEAATIARVPGLERPRPVADRLAKLRANRRRGRWLAPVAFVVVVIVIVVLAASAVSGRGTDPKLLSARRTIAALSARNDRLQIQVQDLCAANRTLREQLGAARTQLRTARAGPQQQRTRKAGGRT